jgi:hypothetical protein
LRRAAHTPANKIASNSTRTAIDGWAKVKTKITRTEATATTSGVIFGRRARQLQKEGHSTFQAGVRDDLQQSDKPPHQNGRTREPQTTAHPL